MKESFDPLTILQGDALEQLRELPDEACYAVAQVVPTGV